MNKVNETENKYFENLIDKRNFYINEFLFGTTKTGIFYLSFFYIILSYIFSYFTLILVGQYLPFTEIATTKRVLSQTNNEFITTLTNTNNIIDLFLFTFYLLLLNYVLHRIFLLRDLRIRDKKYNNLIKFLSDPNNFNLNNIDKTKEQIRENLRY